MYWVSVVTEAGIFAILALGLDVIWGWAGDFDLAFYGYLALGSYLTFVLTIGKPTPPVEYILGYHLPVVLAIALAMVAVVGLAAVIGAIALRNLREIYFAVTTLGAVSALYLLVENYTPLFDGYNGVYGLINPGQTALNLTYNGYRIFFLGVVLVLLLAAYLIVQRLSRSPFGRMLRSVREDERAAAAYGRQVFSAKYRAYLFGAALAGLTGGLFAIFISAFNPSAWTPQELLVIYAAILVGGRGNPRGVILGVFCVRSNTPCQARDSRMVLNQHAGQQEPADLQRDDRIRRNRGAAVPAGPRRTCDQHGDGRDGQAELADRASLQPSQASHGSIPAPHHHACQVDHGEQAPDDDRGCAWQPHGPSQMHPARPVRGDVLHNPILRHPVAPRRKARTGTTRRRHP